MTVTLRLNWPQWQGGEPFAVDSLTPELSQEEGRLAYYIGGRIAALLAPDASGPVADVPVGDYDSDLPARDGIVAKDEMLAQTRAALELIEDHQADRIVTIGGSCSVSIAPLSYLAARYDDDVAIVWMDGHADSNLPGGPNAGLNTMVVSHLTGHGDAEFLALLPGRVHPSNVVLAGVHGWADLDRANVKNWGLTLIDPMPRDQFVANLVRWFELTGCSKVAVHLDLDVIDSDEIAYGMAREPAGITTDTVVASLQALASAGELVGITVAEFVPREAMRLRSLLRDLPLVGR